MKLFTFTSVDDMPVGFWTWSPFIDPVNEWACKGDGSLVVVPDFMDRFVALRKFINKPLPITSGYRSPAYNLVVAHTGEGGPHTTGRACDVAVASSVDAFKLVEAAFRYGFQGIGVSLANGARFVHLDDLPGDANRPRPGLWSY